MRITKDHWLYTTKIAHRGLHDAESFENSLSAYQKAIDKGYAIEIDIHVTADDRIVSVHDGTLDRIAGSPLCVEDSTLAQLKELYIGGTQEKIPTLEEVLALVNGQVPLLIELKADRKVGRLEQLSYEILKDYKGEFAMQSFNPLSIRWFTKHAPHFIRGQLACFNYDNMNKLQARLLKTLAFNPLTRCDFASYCWPDVLSGRAPWPTRFREKNKGALLVWTVRSQEDYDSLKGKCDNIIFEGFIPKD